MFYKKIALMMFTLLIICGCASSHTTTSSALSQIDMTKWLYNADDDVYYQTNIVYCSHPVDTNYQALAIFVPGQYMTVTTQNGDYYSCTVNTEGAIDQYTSATAPIVIPINTPGYSACQAVSGYVDVSSYTNAGYIVVYPGCRGRESGAPAGVTDLKAAIRYIRYCADLLPGDTDRLFAFGMSGGGAQTAILGASGDSDLYTPYLNAIGAADTSDAIAGAMCWCPITNLDSADAAYEWMMGSTRSNLSDTEQSISSSLSEAYVTYINSLKLKDGDTTLTLSSTTSGSYYDYICEVISTSLTHFLKDTSFPYTSNGTTYNTAQEYIDALNSDTTWIKYNTKSQKATVTSIASFVKYFKQATKGIGAFDDLESTQAENQLFGLNGNSGHFDTMLASILEGTSYASDYESDLKKADDQGNDVTARVNMYNPLYYLCDYYDGASSSAVASYWRIRTGINQTDTSLTTEVNLVLALENANKNVDFETVWNQGHTEAERSGTSTSALISWINECLNQ